MAATMAGMPRLGSAAQVGAESTWMISMPASSSASQVPNSRRARSRWARLAKNDSLVALAEAELPQGFFAQGATLRGQLRADIAAAVTRANLIDIDILVHHDDAGFRGFRGQRHDGFVARVAHHGDAVGRLRHGFTQLLRHQLAVPAGEDVFDIRAQVALGRQRAAIDDAGESVALGAAGEEANRHAFAPMRPVQVVLGESWRRQHDDKCQDQEHANQVSFASHFCLHLARV